MKNKTIIFYDFEATSVSRDADPISLGLVAVTRNYKRYESHQVNEMLADTLSIKSNGYQTYDENNNVVKYFVNEHPPTVKTFYGEFKDFQIEKCDDWVKENIVNKLLFKTEESLSNARLKARSKLDKGLYKGSKKTISYELKQWLSQFEEVEFWADFDVIDKPMLIDLIADWDNSKQQPKHKVGLPIHLPNIRYDQFFDLHTLFWLKGVDTDINREDFAIGNGEGLLAHIDTLKGLGINHTKHNALFDSYVNWKCYERLNKM